MPEISDTEASAMSRQAMNELRGLVNAETQPITDFKAPDIAAGGKVEQPITNGQPIVDGKQTTEQQPAPIVAPQAPAQLSDEELHRQIADTKAEIERLTAAETPQGGTAATNEPKPETIIPAGPQVVKMSVDTLVELPDGSKVPWKELEGRMIMQDRISSEKRALHERGKALDLEKQQIEKVKASPLGRTLISAIESGVPDDKVLEVGAAQLGKQIASPTAAAEPEIPKLEDDNYEQKMLARQQFEWQRDNEPLRQEIASLKEEIRTSKQPEKQVSVGEQNQKLIDSVITNSLPKNLTPQAFARIKEHLVVTGARIEVPVDEFSFNTKQLNADQVKALFYAAFPDNQIPAYVLNPQPVPNQPLPREAIVVELQQMQVQLKKLQQQAGLAPPPQPKQPFPEAGAQPAAMPGATDQPQASTGEISEREARQRVNSAFSELRAQK